MALGHWGALELCGVAVLAVFGFTWSPRMKVFRGKTALITGAAGGIGRLMALAFAERGCDVVVADLRLDAAQAVADEVRTRGRRAFARALDVSDPEAVRALKRFVEAEVGSIDVLVNNAGIVFGGPFEQVPLERHLHTYRVNVEGPVALTHAFFTDLLRSQDAHIVNIASASGFIGLPYGATYASSKWAVIGFSESIRLELAQRNARNVAVTTVCPGYIATGMFNGVRAPRLLPVLTPEGIVEKIMQGVESGAEFVKEPFAVKTLDFMRGVLPRKVFELGAQIMGVSSSMMSWQGRVQVPPVAPSNSNGAGEAAA
jgi:all-trans-retinol dehydrogenase (NAD+)